MQRRLHGCVTQAGTEDSEVVLQAQGIFLGDVCVRLCVLGRSRLDWDVRIWGSKRREPFVIHTCKLRCWNSCFSVTGCWLFINHASRQPARRPT